MPPSPAWENRNALKDLLRSTDVYNLEESSARLPYDESKLSLSSVIARDMAPLLGEAASLYASDPQRYILKTDYMMDQLPADTCFAAYTDPLLKDRQTMLGLAHKLHAKGILTFRLVSRCHIGCFTVKRRMTDSGLFSIAGRRTS